MCGVPHPGDGEFEKWAALMGTGLRRAPQTQGTNTVYEPIELGEDLFGHFIYDPLLQAIMRARKQSPDDTGATVLLNTQAYSGYLPVEDRDMVPPSHPLRHKQTRAVATHLQETAESDDWSTVRGIHEATDIPTRTIRDALKALVTEGWLKQLDIDAKTTAYRWSP